MRIVNSLSSRYRIIRKEVSKRKIKPYLLRHIWHLYTSLYVNYERTDNAFIRTNPTALYKVLSINRKTVNGIIDFLSDIKLLVPVYYKKPNHFNKKQKAMFGIRLNMFKDRVKINGDT